MVPLFEKAAKDNHRNAENYSPKRMRKEDFFTDSPKVQLGELLKGHSVG